MADWNTEASLSKQYAVSAKGLRAHSERGNLATMRTASGVSLYDERRVASLFRRRDQDPREVGLIVLGKGRLGTRARDGSEERVSAGNERLAWL